MENYVYEGWARKIGLLIGCSYFIPVLGLTAALDLNGHGIPNDLLVINLALLVFALGIGSLVQASMSVRVKIDMAEGKVAQAWSLFGVTVRRKSSDLSQFERISLHRLYRGGYSASLVGRDRELQLAISTNLGRVRGVAEQAAALTRLKLADNL
jgi:hypothetical protein